jgi:stalled ribosome rescue protein Dom34
MAEHQEKKLAGIWLDSEKAMIIAKEAGVFSVQDTLKGQEAHSGGSEHTMNNAKQSDELKYFKAVTAALLPYDEVLIFGPGQSQEQLQHHLNGQVQFKSKKITIDSSGQLTDNQAIAKVREFFKGR